MILDVVVAPMFFRRSTQKDWKEWRGAIGVDVNDRFLLHLAPTGVWIQPDMEFAMPRSSKMPPTLHARNAQKAKLHQMSSPSKGGLYHFQFPVENQYMADCTCAVNLVPHFKGMHCRLH